MALVAMHTDVMYVTNKGQKPFPKVDTDDNLLSDTLPRELAGNYFHTEHLR